MHQEQFIEWLFWASRKPWHPCSRAVIPLPKFSMNQFNASGARECRFFDTSKGNSRLIAGARGGESRFSSYAGARGVEGLTRACHQIQLLLRYQEHARRYALTDAQWDHIKDLLPGRAGHVGRPAANVACLLRLCCFATVPVCPGAICLSALATFA